MKTLCARIVPSALVVGLACCGTIASGTDGIDPDGRLRRAVEDAAVRAARAAVEAPDRFEVISTHAGNVEAASGPIDELKPLRTSDPGQSGMVRVVLGLHQDGRQVGRATVTVRGAIRGPAIVAREPLPGGQPVPADAVAVEDADLTRLQGAPLRSLEELEGQVPVRTLGAGRVVSKDQLRAEPLVRRGDLVDLELRRGPLLVRTKGTVKRDGAPGETIPAENLATGARLLVEVQQDGSLLVVRGAVPSRTR